MQRESSSVNFTEENLIFNSGGLALSGTLTKVQTAGLSAVVLMLPGSGQIDRDDNSKQLRINVFPQLTPHLSREGLATFRYDKRGVGESEGDFWETGLEDLLADAKQAVSWLKSRDDIDSSKIYLLGHSEGALLAMRVAAEDPSIAGVVLLAGSAKTGEETILWQTKEISQSITGLNRAIIKLLRIDVMKSIQKNLNRIKVTTKDSTRIQGRKINAKWMREFLQYNPRDALGKIQSSVLAITGSNDVQVDPKDLQTMQELILASFESHEIPGLTHLLRIDSSGQGLKTYKKQTKQPVDQSVVDEIIGWFQSQGKDSKR
jgi:pimeloyl-ACP methyl ester carboxylesterase